MLLRLLVLLCVLLQAQARDAAMQVQAAVLTAQNIHLRRELASGWAAADSNLIQVTHDNSCHEFRALLVLLGCPYAAGRACRNRP